MESEKKLNLLLWSSVAAAVAGVATAVAIAQWRDHTVTGRSVTKRLRDVQEVLSDCYHKINEIERHIPELRPITPGNLAAISAAVPRIVNRSSKN